MLENLVSLSQVNTLAVHNGVFHADDVFCGVMVRICNPTAKIVRTRDTGLISSCDLAADVGYGKYDHHQEDAAIRENGIKYCGCGLLWRDFSKEIIIASLKLHDVPKSDISDEIVGAIANKIDVSLIMFLDGSDNGMKLFNVEEGQNIITISGIISSYNIPGASLNGLEEYNKACRFADSILNGLIFSYYCAIRVEGNTNAILPVDYENFNFDHVTNAGMLEFLRERGFYYNTSGDALDIIKENLSDILSSIYSGNIYSDEVVSYISVELEKKFRAPLTFLTVHNQNQILHTPDTFMIPTLDYIFTYIDNVDDFGTFFSEYFTNEIRSLVFVVENRIKVKEAYDVAIKEGKHYIFLEEAGPWKKALYELDQNNEIYYVVYGYNRGSEYRIQAVPLSPTEMTCRYYLPESWRSLQSEELSRVCGVPNAIFCHHSGFLCGNKTKDGILKMADKAIQAIQNNKNEEGKYMIYYRPHRATLGESLEEMKEFESEEEMKKYILNYYNNLLDNVTLIDYDDIVIDSETMIDDRLPEWGEISYVCVKRLGKDTYKVPQCIGMCGYPLGKDEVQHF